MGWGRMLLLGNLGQQLDIQDTRSELDRITAHLKADGQFNRQTKATLSDLTKENAELKLYLAALIRLLTVKGVVTPAELASIVEAVDQSDGSADGGFSGPITNYD